MHRARFLFAKAFLVVASAAALSGCEPKGPVQKTEVAKVVSRLEKSASARAKAEARLKQSDPFVTWQLLAPLIDRKTASAEARAAAIRAVRATQRNLGLPGAVVRATRDPDPVVRREAIAAVVERADPDTARALADFAGNTKDPQVKADLEKALVELKGRERHWYRGQLFHAETAMDRAMAARWLSEIGTEEDVPELVRAAETFPADQLLQQEVILALSKIGGDAAKGWVLRQLVAEDPFMRGIAAFAETRLKDPAAIPALEALLAEETVGDTRVSAATALGAIASEEAKGALERSCKLGHPDKRVTLACSDARKALAAKE